MAPFPAGPVAEGHTGEIVEVGFEAAIGRGEVLAWDRYTTPVSGELRLLAPGAPPCFEDGAAP